MITLYHFGVSGNSHKVRLMLSLLGLNYESITPTNGQHKDLAFLKLNPFGQVPVLVDDDIVIWDSQAILVYLARRYGGEDWLPLEAEPMAKVMQWLSTAANEIQHGLSATRLYYLLNVKLDVELAEQKSYLALGVLEQHLQERQWLECDRPTLADIACFPYVALAGDAKISLEPYPHVVAWIERIKQLPGFIGMPGIYSSFEQVKA